MTTARSNLIARLMASGMSVLAVAMAVGLCDGPPQWQARVQPAAEFRAVDVVIECGDTPLAAYQVEITSSDGGLAAGQAPGQAPEQAPGQAPRQAPGQQPGNAQRDAAKPRGESAIKLTGVEGGEERQVPLVPGKPAMAGAFAEAPRYDPAALHEAANGGRIILAAISTRKRDELPTGSVRVARLHVLVPAAVPGSDAPAATLNVKLIAAGDHSAARFTPTVRLVWREAK